MDAQLTGPGDAGRSPTKEYTVTLEQPPIEVNVSEIDGAYFPVRLHAIPRVGDLIDLYSSIDHSTGHPPRKHYEVVQVLHKLHDVTDKVPHATGHHFLTIVVKPSTSKYFSHSPS